MTLSQSSNSINIHLSFKLSFKKTIYCCNSIHSVTNRVNVLREHCMFLLHGRLRGWQRNTFTLIIQILTWDPWSTDVSEIFLVAWEVRGTFPSKTISHPNPIISNKAHHKGQHKESAGCWQSHLQSWWLDLQVWQWETQCMLTQSSWMANNNTALSMIIAIIIQTAQPTLADKRVCHYCPSQSRDWDRVV